jgi:hypothetical protein
MKRLLAAALSLAAFNCIAGTCTNASLVGGYTVNVAGDLSGQPRFFAGRFVFNGKGGATLGGVGSIGGAAYTGNGGGTYSVSPSCTVAGTIAYPNGQKTSYWVYLDNIDASAATNVPYHGSVVLKNTAGASGGGTIDRVIGRF